MWNSWVYCPLFYSTTSTLKSCQTLSVDYAPSPNKPFHPLITHHWLSPFDISIHTSMQLNASGVEHFISLFSHKKTSFLPLSSHITTRIQPLPDSRHLEESPVTLFQS
ncbi:UNVERIFIED_CONTAM: hypothetical protein K2H54_019638 [Gekko kuhli]